LITDLVTFRNATSEDEAFIYDSWVKSNQRSMFARFLDPKIYAPGHRAAITRLLPRTQVLIAGSKLDEEGIRGWICFEPDCLHYIFVKLSFRKFGLAHSLIEQAQFENDVTYSHERMERGADETLASLPQKLLGGGAYDPYRFFV